jgi:hypothetical protein
MDHDTWLFGVLRMRELPCCAVAKALISIKQLLAGYGGMYLCQRCHK